MGLVDKDHRAVGMGDLDEFGHRGDIAQHRIKPLNHHQARALGGQARQALIEVLGAVVAKADGFSIAQAASVIDAGMAVGVDQQVIAAPGKGAEGRQICLIAGGADHSRGRTEILFQVSLKIKVQAVGAIGKTAAGGGGAMGVNRLFGGLHDISVIGQTEIVVGAGQQDFGIANPRTGLRQHFVEPHAKRRAPCGAQFIDTLGQFLELCEYGVFVGFGIKHL